MYVVQVLPGGGGGEDRAPWLAKYEKSTNWQIYTALNFKDVWNFKLLTRNQQFQTYRKSMDMENSAINASVMSTESLIMSLLGQIQCLETERDNARVLAARMRERLERTNNNNFTALEKTNGHKSEVIHSPRLVKMVKNVSSGMLNSIQQVIDNEEYRYYNLKELGSEGETEQAANLRGQLSVCKQHYEMLLEEAEKDKTELRRKLKEQQDMLLDKDIKIKELERKLEHNPS